MPVDHYIEQTDRLNIRYFDRETDELIFHLYRNDEVISKYQSWNPPFTQEQLDSFFNSMEGMDIFSAEGWLQLALEHRERGELIGDVAFNLNDRTAEMGITIRREFQQQGYGKEAITGLLHILFHKLDTHRVIALLDEGNIGSMALFESLDFRQEGHFIKSYWDDKLDEWRNEFLYAMIEEEFNYN